MNLCWFTESGFRHSWEIYKRLFISLLGPKHMGILISQLLEGTPYLLDANTGAAILNSASGLSEDVEVLRSGGKLVELAAITSN